MVEHVYTDPDHYHNSVVKRLAGPVGQLEEILRERAVEGVRPPPKFTLSQSECIIL